MKLTHFNTKALRNRPKSLGVKNVLPKLVTVEYCTFVPLMITNMRTKILSVAAALFLGLGLLAQDGAFKVLSVKGDNALEKSGEFVALGPGMQLPKNAKIMLGEGGVVELSNSANQTVTMNQPGIYTMDDVAGNFKADNSSLAQRYMSYVIEEMKGETSGRTSNLSLTGSVERSLDKSTINLFSPESTYIMGKTTHFKWESKAEASTYQIVVLNLFDEPVIKETVTGNSAAVDFSKIEFEEDGIYKLKVSDATNPKVNSGDLILRSPTKEEIALIEKDLGELSKEADDNSPIYHAVMAKFYKVNGFYVDAIAHYEKAIALAPNSRMIKMEYDAFLKQAGVRD